MAPEQVIAFSNLLIIFVVSLIAYVFYRKVYRPWKYTKITFRLYSLRDRLDRIVYGERKLRTGGFLHRFLSQEINICIRSAESFSLHLIIRSLLPSRGAFTDLIQRFENQITELPDPELAKELVEIRCETMSCVINLIRINSNFVLVGIFLFRIAEALQIKRLLHTMKTFLDWYSNYSIDGQLYSMARGEMERFQGSSSPS